MAKGKSPFVGFTVEEVFRAEESSFVIQVGNDFHRYKDSYSFNKRVTAIQYNKILNELLDMYEGGDKKEKKQADYLIKHLFIYPLRLH